MITKEDARQLAGQDLFDRNGDRIGEIRQVFVDDTTAEPTWVAVRTGWFGVTESFVPLAGVDASGRELRAAFDKSTVKDAPRLATDEPLTVQDEDSLYRHYGLSDPSVNSAVDRRDVAGQSTTSDMPGASRGRMRRFEHPDERAWGLSGITDARVCPRCGSYVAAERIGQHEEFHRTAGQPAGNYARHDVPVAGQDAVAGHARVTT